MANPPLLLRKVIKIGNSIGVTIDRAILDRVGIKLGGRVAVTPGKRKGTLTIKKLKS